MPYMCLRHIAISDALSMECGITLFPLLRKRRTEPRVATSPVVTNDAQGPAVFHVTQPANCFAIARNLVHSFHI
jgi:hypothetical protein